MTSYDRPPTGFELPLVGGWRLVEVSAHGWPGAATTFRRLQDVEHAGDGVLLRASYEEEADDVPVRAELVVGAYVVDTGNDITTLRVELNTEEPGERIDLVGLTAGPAVRRSGFRSADVVQHFYVPVPGTLDQVFFAGFSSPALDREGEVRQLFDDMAANLAFSWATEEARAPSVAAAPPDPSPSPFTPRAPRTAPASRVPRPGRDLPGLVRALFAGWPQRFDAPSHAGVALWALAGLLFLVQVGVAISAGAPGLALSRFLSGVFLGAAGPLGYAMGGRPLAYRVTWLVLGAGLCALAVGCPEGSRLGTQCTGGPSLLGLVP